MPRTHRSDRRQSRIWLAAALGSFVLHGGLVICALLVAGRPTPTASGGAARKPTAISVQLLRLPAPTAAPSVPAAPPVAPRVAARQVAAPTPVATAAAPASPPANEEEGSVAPGH